MKKRWSIDQLYFYLVCFVMLITIIVGVTNLVRAGIDILLPYENEWNEPAKPGYYVGGETKSQLPVNIIEKELELQEEHLQNVNKSNAFNSSILSLIRGMAQILVAFPVYLFHWRKIPLLSTD